MSTWPLILRLMVAFVPFAACVWAFSNGVMILAVPALFVAGWLFHRLFLRDQI